MKKTLLIFLGLTALLISCELKYVTNRHIGKCVVFEKKDNGAVSDIKVITPAGDTIPIHEMAADLRLNTKPGDTLDVLKETVFGTYQAVKVKI